jgi:hypothetical protein
MAVAVVISACLAGCVGSCVAECRRAWAPEEADCSLSHGLHSGRRAASFVLQLADRRPSDVLMSNGSKPVMLWMFGLVLAVS